MGWSWKFWASDPYDASVLAKSQAIVPTTSTPQSQTPPPTIPSSEVSATSEQQVTHQSRLTPPQKLFLAGTASFLFTIFVTRRSLARRRTATLPPYWTAAPEHKPPVNSTLDAVSALNIATMNVFSVAAMGLGGVLWHFDIQSLADLRRKVRGGLGVDGTGRGEQEVEEDFEEWVVSVLARKEDKEAVKKMKGSDRVVNERGQER